jgi:hypothetical protein
MPYEVKEPSEALPMNLNLTSCGQTFVVKLGAVSDKTLSRLKGWFAADWRQVGRYTERSGGAAEKLVSCSEKSIGIPVEPSRAR